MRCRVPSRRPCTQARLTERHEVRCCAGGGDERSGIGSGSKTRIYPVRKGETIQAIAANRGIPLDKLTQLNPAMDLNKLKGGEKLLLPGGYYTVREKEMLSTVQPLVATLLPPYVFARAPNNEGWRRGEK